MKNFIKQIFEDSTGGYSMQRFGTAVCLFAFLVLVGTIIYIALHIYSPVIINSAPTPVDTKVLDSLIYFAIADAALGLGIKAVSRWGEKSNETEARIPEGK